MKVTSLLNTATRSGFKSIKSFLGKNKIYTGGGVLGSAIGGYRGYEGSNRNWRRDPLLREDYQRAYGNKAFKVYREKNIITGVASGFIDGFAATAFVGEGIKRRLGKVSNPEPKMSRMKGFMKNWVLPVARDTAIIYGASNAYGEYKRRSITNTRYPKRQGYLKSKNTSKQLSKKNSFFSWKNNI